jgi:hypothetical protein
MIKFVAAALWICVATAAAVVYSFQTNAPREAGASAPAFEGGLDYVKTDVISVPVMTDGTVRGYFLARLVFTADPRQLKSLSIPAQTLIVDQVYSYLYGNPQVDFSQVKTLDLDAFRRNIRDSINQRVAMTLIHDVLVEQVDFLSKDEIRDNALRRRIRPSKPQDADAKS